MPLDVAPGLFDLPHARSTDPDTSHAAAAGCAHDEIVGQALLNAMPFFPGRNWTDAEMGEYLRGMNMVQWSDGRVRHGRKHLSDHGLIVLAMDADGTPLRRKTRLGASARCWRTA